MRGGGEMWLLLSHKSCLCGLRGAGPCPTPRVQLPAFVFKHQISAFFSQPGWLQILESGWKEMPESELSCPFPKRPLVLSEKIHFPLHLHFLCLWG